MPLYLNWTESQFPKLKMMIRVHLGAHIRKDNDHDCGNFTLERQRRTAENG